MVKNSKKLVSLITVVAVVMSLFAGLSVNAADSTMSIFSVYGNYETAGITIETVGSANGVYAEIWYNEVGATAYGTRGHNFVKYDGNHLATSLFDLKPGTAYNFQVRRKTGEGGAELGTLEGTFTTKNEAVLPKPSRILNVRNVAQLLGGINLEAKPGDELRIYPTTKLTKNITISNLKGTAAKPIVISAGTDVTVPLYATITLRNCEYVIINNLEVSPGSRAYGIHLMTSKYITIKDCYVHDSADMYDGGLIMISGSGKIGARDVEGHTIINNILSDEDQESKNWYGPENSKRQTYFGINMRNYPGGFVTIRGNTIYGVTDAMHPGAEEGKTPLLKPDDLNVLNTYKIQNLDIYDNIMYNCRDDGIELDGCSTNVRIFKNHFGNSSSPISLAPVYPGPFFVVKNYATGWHSQVVKLNTNVQGVSRNALIYNNTFVVTSDVTNYADGTSPGTKCIYIGEPANQRDYTYMNNILYSKGRIIDADISQDNGTYHVNNFFNYNLDYSTKQINPEGNYASVLYKWNSTWRKAGPNEWGVEKYGMEATNIRANNIEDFRKYTKAHDSDLTISLASADRIEQQANGKYADPFMTHTDADAGKDPNAANIAAGYWTRYTKDELGGKDWTIGAGLSRDVDYRADAGMYHITLPATSPAKDMGVVIPGITNNAIGAPDAGAYEIGTVVTPKANIPKLSDATGVPQKNAKAVAYPPKKPSKVSGVKVKSKKKGSVEITWKKLKKNTTGYKVEISKKTKKKGWKTVKTISKAKTIKYTKKAKTLNLTKKGLPKGKNVYIRVRAMNVFNKYGFKDTAYGKYSAVKKVKVKKK